MGGGGGREEGISGGRRARSAGEMDDAIGLLGSEAIAAARSSSQGGQDARSAAARPDGVNRELYALLQQESDGLPPLIPTARPGPTSYKDRKAGGTKWCAASSSFPLVRGRPRLHPQPSPPSPPTL